MGTPQVWMLLTGVLVHPMTGEPQSSAIVAARIQPGRAVEIYDSVSGGWRQVYQSSAWSLDGHGLSVSPDGKYMGLVETSEGMIANGEYTRLPRNRLVILSPSGATVAIIDRDVRKYTWCCGSSSVAFIEGPYREDGIGYGSTGTFIMNFLTGVETEIRLPPLADERFLRVYDVNFATFDGALYLRTLRPLAGTTVFRYVNGAGSPEPTLHRGVHFSPSGRFYLAHAWPDGPDFGAQIFDRQSEAQLALPDSTLGSIVGWVTGSDDRLLLERSRWVLLAPGSAAAERAIGSRPRRREVVGYTIYRLVDRSVVTQIDGIWERGVAARPGILPILQGGRLEIHRQQ